MKKFIIATMAVAISAGLVQASTIEFNFNGASGETAAASANDFGAGVTVSDAVLAGGSGAVNIEFQNDQAELSIRNPDHTLTFTVIIDDTVTVDLTNLDFVYGFSEDFHPNTVTPSWNLTLSTGTPSATSGSVGAITALGDVSKQENLTLSGLTGLTDTAVTFTFNFSDAEGRHAGLNRANTMDNIVITGIPEPATIGMVAMFGGGIFFIRRKLMM